MLAAAPGLVVAAAAVAVVDPESHMTMSSIAGLLRIMLLACTLAWPLAHAQKTYPTPDAAADALTDALRRFDDKALAVVLGANYKTFVRADSVERADIETYLAAWDKQHKVNKEGENTAIVAAGESGWTLPIPIVKRKSGWRFDLAAGADEMRTRRIGRNELAAIQAVLAYFDAQREYAIEDRNGNGVREYAQKLVSTPGKKDGLYWQSPLGIDESPLGPLFAVQKPRGPGYYGYNYKILKSQGKDAPGGAYDYMIGGRMRSGFALIAWPVRYGDTGVMSFMVSHAGIVYQKDLGPSTETVAGAMTRFNPDPSWTKAPIPN